MGPFCGDKAQPGQSVRYYVQAAVDVSGCQKKSFLLKGFVVENIIRLCTAYLDPPLLMMLTAVELSHITVKCDRGGRSIRFNRRRIFVSSSVNVTILETRGPVSTSGDLKVMESPSREEGVSVS